MAQKTIKLNPEYLSLNNRKHNKSTKTKKEKPKSGVNPNKLRKELLTRIKNHQHKSSEENKKKDLDTSNEKNSINNDFNNDFNKSIDYLEQLSKNKTNEKNRQKQMKKTKKRQERQERQETPSIFVNTCLPEEMKIDTNSLFSKNNEKPTPILNNIVDMVSHDINSLPTEIKTTEPLYGCLKNGAKPTYKQLYTRKNKENNTLPIPIHIEGNILQQPQLERAQKLEEFKTKYKKEIRPVKQKKSKTLRFHLGKKDNNISILIKNNETRKKIKKAHAELKKTSVPDIKKYLKQHNLLKVGSEAPNDVLRQMYEQVKLTGEINNKNSDNLLHNFLTK